MTGSIRNSRSGFTLVELMIVVAIIGVLASVAIPSFVNYQLTSKRTEAYANLSSLAKAQKAYFAEFSDFVATPAEPWLTSGDLPTSTKRDSAPIGDAFLEIGWEPEGEVFFDYDTATGERPLNGTCTCAEACFTASAYGDLDANDLFSIVIYAHPDVGNEYCTTGRAGGVGGSGPWHPPTNSGSERFDEVARVSNVLADEF